MEQRGSHSTDFREIWYKRIFRKFVTSLEVPLKSDKNNKHFTWRLIHICDLSSLSSFENYWEIFQTKFIEKIKTHFKFNNFISSPNRAVYEIMWKNILEPGRPQMTMWRMRIVCWIPKVANTHSEYVILIAFPLQQLLQEGAFMLHYTCIDCLIVTTSLYDRNTTLQISCT